MENHRLGRETHRRVTPRDEGRAEGRKAVPSPVTSASPVPRFEGVAGSFEQVALHHHSVGGVDVELLLRVVVGEVLTGREE